MFRITLSFILICLAITAFGQPIVADKIVAQVGNNIVLQSEVEEQYTQDKMAYSNLPEDYRCIIVYNLMSQQILVEQASRDSIIVTDEEVESILDQRIRYWMQEYGSKERLEEVSGRTLYQLRDDFRPFFKDKTIAERMQAQVMQHVKITPAEINAYYNKIPKDSLPLYPATVEMGQIVINPDVNPEIDKLAKEKLEGIRKDIVEGGKSFQSMAGIYSMDPGSKNTGGELDINRKEADPKFIAAAFRLQPGEISPVIKSGFGYHIIQMVRRMGEDAKVRHILIIPEITNYDLQQSLKKLDSVRSELVSGSLDFAAAVGKYSNDDQSKMTGGMVMLPQTGSTILEIDKLDPAMARAVADLKVGEYSLPQIFTPESSTNRSTRILYLKSRTDAHVLNLKDDYANIQQVALQTKQNEYMADYIKEKVPTYYIMLDQEFKDCAALKPFAEAVTAP